ncbi:MAG TPA: FecR family protein [Terriglobales bacterium]|nr:FecR family protein [Terriglobales bacterium]
MPGRWKVATFLLAAVLAAGVLALADSYVRIVRVSFLAHQVEVSRPAAAAAGATRPRRWSTALLNAPVVQSERLRTRAAGEAEVQLECGSALRLAPDSELVFSKLSLLDSGVRATTVTLRRGTAYFTLQRADSPDFHVLLPGGEISTPNGGASLRVAAPDDAPATVELLAGHAVVTAEQQKFVLKKSRTLALLPDGGVAWRPAAPPDLWQRWSRSRDQAFQRAVNASVPKLDMDAHPLAPPPPQPNIAGTPDLYDPLPADATRMFNDSDPFVATARAIAKVPYCANN